MGQPLTILLSATILVSMAVPANAKAPKRWPVKKTWVMMVGVLDYKNADVYTNMGTRDRRDQTLYDAIIKCGVPKKQTIFLTEEDATLANIQKEFAALLKKTKKGDFLIVYFDGHGTHKGGKGRLAPWDAGDGNGNQWKVTNIFKRIEKDFRGDQVLMIADCCHSGAMGDEMMELKTKKGYACLSSAPLELTSADSWAFTEALVDGFKGAAHVDTNSDGQISLGELKDYAFKEMQWFCEQDSHFARNDNFPENFALVKTKKSSHEDIGKYFQVKIDGKKRWRQARAVEVKGNSTKFLYYPDGFVGYTTIKTGSKDIRLKPTPGKKTTKE